MLSKQQIYDASFCNRLPIHQINAIQPQGVLSVVSKQDFKIIQVSANASALYPFAAEELIGKNFADFIEAQSLQTIKEELNHYSYPTPLEIVFKPNTESAKLSLVHEKSGALHIETELSDYSNTSINELELMTKVQQFMAAVNGCSSIDEVANVAAKQIKNISGFDKVMVYCFDEEWVGSVIAEEMKPGMESYLGLRFPATDIPKQARDLYLKNPYRLIPDRDYTPVPLIPELNSLTRQITDLSECKFRAVPPVHLEYLKNMNVVTSMSTRIIHKEQLWGLIACHHITPKYLSFSQCAFFELISSVISAKITSLVYKSVNQKETYLRSHFKDIITIVRSFENLTTAFDDVKHQLMTVLSADGVALCSEGEISSVGILPEEEEIFPLVEWLQQNDISHTTQFQALPYHFKPAEQFSETGSGLLVLPIQPYEGKYLLAFRPEAKKKVSWGGDPNNILTVEPGTSKYHPRNSFEIWKEVIRFTAEPWDKTETDIAEALRISLVEFTLKRLADEYK